MQIKNLVATVGEYTNKSGETKKQYLNIGKLMIKDDGKMSIKLDCIPTHSLRDGRAGVYDIKDEKKQVADRPTAPTEDTPF